MTNSSPDCTNTLVGTIRVKSTSLEIDGAEDHVHILAKLPPKILVADFLEKFKANTSNWAKSIRRGFGCEVVISGRAIALLEAHGVKYDPDRI